MKKQNFVSLLLGVIGGVLFGLGMCMCLLEEWNAFRPGLIPEEILTGSRILGILQKAPAFF